MGRWAGERRIADVLADGAVANGSLRVAGALDVDSTLNVDGIATLSDLILPGASEIMEREVSDSGALNAVSETCYAAYVGEARRRFATGRAAKIEFYVSTAATTFVEGEVAIATGDLDASGGNPSLTKHSHVALVAGDLSGNNTPVRKALTLSSAIATGTGLWLLLYIKATSAGTLRTRHGGDFFRGYFANKATTKPSTMAANTTFTVTQTGWQAALKL